MRSKRDTRFSGPKWSPTYCCILIWLTPLMLLAQRYEKVQFNEGNSKTDYFLKLDPQDLDSVREVLVLVPGFGQTPETIFTESMLPYVAHATNIMVIAIAGGDTIFALPDVVGRFNTVFELIIAKHGLQTKKWVMGGFSAGGSIAMRYVELANEKQDAFPVRFSGVFSVDSPVDLVQLWDYFEREITKKGSEAGVSESVYISNLMKEQAGVPSKNGEVYQKLNPFDVTRNWGNERYLMDASVRVYHDVDISWQLNQRKRSVYDSNYLAASEMILRLMLQGHGNAEFIQGKTGYRSNGMRHPHSWSIVDEVECIQWVRKLPIVKDLQH